MNITGVRRHVISRVFSGTEQLNRPTCEVKVVPDHVTEAFKWEKIQSLSLDGGE